MIKRMAPSLLKAALQRQTREATAKLAQPAKRLAPKELQLATRISRDVFEAAPASNSASGLGNDIGVVRSTDIQLARHPQSSRPLGVHLENISREDLEKLIELAREAGGSSGPVARGQDKEWGEDTQIHRPDGSVFV